MASEARLNVGLQITKGNMQYRSSPSAFTADVSVASAPTPGRVLVATSPTLISLAALTVPGLGTIQNLDATNYVELGMYNSDDNEFLPMLEILPGEIYPLRFSRILGQEVVGTGTTGSTTSLALRANTAPCQCDIRVFEK